MKIRKLREDDLGALLAIETATQAAPWTDKVFKECFQAKYPGWVIEHDDMVVCFTLISMNIDECHLLNLCVHPRYQRQGFGEQMLSHAVQSAKDLGAVMIYLEVRETNTRAIALYKKHRFTHIGTRKDYYTGIVEREDALVFARDLGLER